jgi:hypothetical protein
MSTIGRVMSASPQWMESAELCGLAVDARSARDTSVEQG